MSAAKIRGVSVTPAQAEVYKVLRKNRAGIPDHTLVPLAQHFSEIRLSSSGIRTRRKELTDAGLVRKINRRVRMPSGRTAALYKAVV